MTAKMTALDAYSGGMMTLPPGYRLEHGPDVMLLCRHDGSAAAAFSSGSTPPSEVARTVEQDYGAWSFSPMPRC